MGKNEFFKTVANTYFEPLECSVADLVEMLTPMLPIFGVAVVEVIETNDGKTLRVIDKDYADCYVAPEGVEVTDEMLDMSTVAMVLYVDKVGVVTFVEHNFKVFTKSNKNNVLFYSSLLGKTIVFE